jgi:glycosyltransferase involved in cell wall biosynthesis
VTTVFFVVPAHGRLEKTAVCLRQLKRTCDALSEQGFDASAVVVAQDENLETAKGLGFPAVRQDNYPLGRKWNDGYQYAARHGDADYVIPLGSDDWVDPIILADLPGPTEIRCHRLSSVVSEDGQRISPLRIWYDGGDGVRIFPRNLIERLGCRPADEHRDRAIDTSIMHRLVYLHQGNLPPLKYFDASPWQIVDWKTRGGQLNTYEACLAYRYEAEQDAWEILRDRYPAESLEEMRKVYGLVAA